MVWDVYLKAGELYLLRFLCVFSATVLRKSVMNWQIMAAHIRAVFALLSEHFRLERNTETEHGLGSVI